MPDSEIPQLSVFQAQTRNVRELQQAWTHINRQLNSLLIQNNEKGVEINTKVLALIYCALAEAIFSKLINTPSAFQSNEIEQIKNATAANGVKSGWLKCAELALRYVEGTKHNHRPNVLKKLSALIEEFIYDPSVIRNKLAHGQWCVALNRENSAVNEEITRELEKHTIIQLYRRKRSMERLATIIEDIIESPNKAHRRDYYSHLTALEVEQRETSQWTIEEKIKRLRAKRSHSGR